MRRRPNLWIVLPALVSGFLAAWLGGTITAVSCRYQEADGTVVTCPGWTATIAVLSFLVIGAGVLVVMVLVFRSLAEWREQQKKAE
jgi:hypothetical protein